MCISYVQAKGTQIGDLSGQGRVAKLCVAKLELPGRRSLATLFGVIKGRRHAFLKIVFLMTHLAIFWYLKREASLFFKTIIQLTITCSY
jgi:hypothetical protein